MDWTGMIEQFGDHGALAFAGLVVGLLFGAMAMHSRFCLRAATVEFWRGHLGPKTAIWLLTFAAALGGVQFLFWTGRLEADAVRQLSNAGTMSGAIIGGLMFGVGMILARGCASRLLVLSGTGNLRALVAGLILTVVAQASLRGVLSIPRVEMSSWWVVGPETRNLMAYVSPGVVLLGAAALLAFAVWLAIRNRVAWHTSLAAMLVGGAVALGWFLTADLAGQSFELIPVQSVSFTGPSADTLMTLINAPSVTLDFGLGLVPGVFVGSFLMAVLTGQFRIQTFTEDTPLPRYIAGACLMGFGSMLAGGCAVGAGVTGGAAMALTAWVALFSMWVAAGLTDFVVDRPRAEAGLDVTFDAAHMTSAQPGARPAI